MSIRKKGLFINGIYRDVVEGILDIQRELPEHIMFLQPYSSRRIVGLDEKPPTVKDRVRLYLSTMDDLSTVEYEAEIVGWDNKQTISENKANVVRRLLCTLQPKETGMNPPREGEKASGTNLLHVWRMRKLEKPFSVGELILFNTDEPHSTNRVTAGGWSYVKNRE